MMKASRRAWTEPVKDSRVTIFKNSGTELASRLGNSRRPRGHLEDNPFAKTQPVAHPEKDFLSVRFKFYFVHSESVKIRPIAAQR